MNIYAALSKLEFPGYDGTHLPIGCWEKAGGGRSLVGMVTGGSCWAGWCWRCDHSNMNWSPGGVKKKKSIRDKRNKENGPNN